MEEGYFQTNIEETGKVDEPEVIKLERAYSEWKRVWSDFVYGKYGELGNIHR